METTDTTDTTEITETSEATEKGNKILYELFDRLFERTSSIDEGVTFGDICKIVGKFCNSPEGKDYLGLFDYDDDGELSYFSGKTQSFLDILENDLNIRVHYVYSNRKIAEMNFIWYEGVRVKG